MTELLTEATLLDGQLQEGLKQEVSQVYDNGQTAYGEQLTTKPFEIRGHRLFTVFFSPKVFSEGGLRWVSNQIREMNRTLRQNIYHEVYDSDGVSEREYAKDILGTSPNNKVIAEHNKQDIEYIKELLALPDEAPVLLTRKPDKLCGFCAIGEHCTNRKHGNNPDNRAESRDKEGIELFIEITEWLGGKEGEDFTVKWKPRRKEPDIESVRTTKKTVVAMILERGRYVSWEEEQKRIKFEQWLEERGYSNITFVTPRFRL